LSGITTSANSVAQTAAWEAVHGFSRHTVAGRFSAQDPQVRPGRSESAGRTAPVFALAAETDVSALPRPQPWTTQSGMEYLGERFVLRAYDGRERIVHAELSAPPTFRQDLARLFGH
jgi:hypothetical protein